jgi:hypothetical protein
LAVHVDLLPGGGVCWPAIWGFGENTAQIMPVDVKITCDGNIFDLKPK